MEKERSAFDQSLSNFVHDFASGAAIRHLADQGLTVSEIREKLLYPTPKERIARTVWEHYVKTGKIRLEQPKGGETIRKVQYVKEYNAYGKASLRAVTTQESLPYEAYIPCDFGIRIYQSRAAFEEEIRELPVRDRQYLTELPWPPAVVWHAADERMKRIMEEIGTMRTEPDGKDEKN